MTTTDQQLMYYMKKDLGQSQYYMKEVDFIEKEKPGSIQETGVAQVCKEFQSNIKNSEAKYLLMDRE
jgi:hypothetical protein